jgi:hypothetical protein
LKVLEEEEEWENGREVPMARVEDNCVVSTRTVEHLVDLLTVGRIVINGNTLRTMYL